MGMLGLQITIAKLCLSRNFRSEFRTDADAAVQQMALGDEEAASAKQLDLEAVSEFGESLISKRINMIRRWFPMSFAALDRHVSPTIVNRRLDRFTQDHVRDGDEYATIWRLRESARVTEYLTQLVTQGDLPLPPAADVVRFEAERLRLTLDPDAFHSAIRRPAPRTALADETVLVRPPHASVLTFRYNVALLIKLIEEGFGIDDLVPEACNVLFIRRGTDGMVETHVTGEGSYRIVAHCSRPTRVQDLLTAMKIAYGFSPELDATLREELARLIALGALKPL